jgi:hypothetical protein
MPYGPFLRTVGHHFPLALMATSTTAQVCPSCFQAPDAGMSVPALWINVYKLAYEQARIALEPSRFQVVFQPCWN